MSEYGILTSSQPYKFWSAIVALVVAISGGAGTTSYRMAQAATETTAENTAKATAQKETQELRAEMNTRLDNLEQKVDENGRRSAGVARDIDWIRKTLETMEKRQYDQRPNGN